METGNTMLQACKIALNNISGKADWEHITPQEIVLAHVTAFIRSKIQKLDLDPEKAKVAEEIVRSIME